jgi:predicted RNA-binding Zn ribbon-like protein
MSTSSLGPENFPLLGEPFAIEFANTLYESAEQLLDFLATRELIEAWFLYADTASPYQLPKLINDRLSDLRELRNAVHSLCRHLAGETVKIIEATAILNRYAGIVPARLELQWLDPMTPAALLVHAGSVADTFISSIASDVIAFLASPSGGKVRRCETPVCTLFFLQEHHRRRFCSEPCSQRTRQSRYYQSSK